MSSRLHAMARLLLATPVLAGCAAGVPRSVEQVVRVETPGCAGARCLLRNDMGVWIVDSTPGEARVRTSSQALQLQCQAGAHGVGSTTAAQPRGPGQGRDAAVGAGVAGGATAAALAPALATPWAPAAGAVIAIAALAGAAAGDAAGASRRVWGYPTPTVVPLDCAADPSIDEAAWGMQVVGEPDADAVRVRAVARAGAAAAAGLRAGDRIVAVDGQPVGGTAGLEGWLRGAQAAVTLRVLRDGQLADVVLDRRAAR